MNTHSIIWNQHGRWPKGISHEDLGGYQWRKVRELWKQISKEWYMNVISRVFFPIKLKWIKSLRSIHGITFWKLFKNGMSHKEIPQNWLSPICHGYFRNSKWPFKVLSISSFCGMGLSVIRTGLRKVLSIFFISPLSHLPFPSQPTTIELSNPSIPTKQLLSRSSTTPFYQITKRYFTFPIVPLHFSLSSI